MMNIKTFLFHRINTAIDPVWPPMHPDLFNTIVLYLKTNFEIVPLENTIIGNYKPLGRKPLCSIVFDDGYKDFDEYALPLIKKHNIPVSLYVITDCVSKNVPQWTYLLNFIFSNTMLSSVEIESPYIPENLKKNIWSNSSDKISFVQTLSPVLKTVPNSERENIFSQIRQQIDDVPDPKNLMLGWDSLRSIQQEGIEIGSHTVSHPLLSEMLFSANINAELKHSAEEIEKKIGKFPLAISYPFGSYDYRVKKIAKEVGYKMGLCVHAHTKQYDAFEIPRIQLYNESMLKTKLRINGQLQKFKSFFTPNLSQHS